MYSIDTIHYKVIKEIEKKENECLKMFSDRCKCFDFNRGKEVNDFVTVIKSFDISKDAINKIFEEMKKEK